MAQDYHVRVVLKDGQVVTWPVSELEYIDFPAKGELTAKYELSLINDEVVWDSNDHSAFTCLTEWGGQKLLAFREGAAHRPTNISDYGHITILQESEGQWVKIEDLLHQDMDLRDPFFVEIGGNIRMYCGYNQFVGDKYQHSGTVYSDLSDEGWSEFTPIQHDVPHITWLWKIRKYKDSFYGIGYLEGEKPVLLKSTDGIIWTTVTVFQLEGVLSEADLCFSGDSMYVCLRQDTPIGSPSHWGKSKFPFTEFEWGIMDYSVASPELLIHPLSHQMFLAGREYDYREDKKQILVSLFEVTAERMATKLHTFETEDLGDKGYPSMLLKDNKLYVSYYYGQGNTKIGVATFSIIENMK